MSAMIIRITTNENSKAAAMMVFCKAVNPPTYNKTSATDDCANPQATFTLFGGVSNPFVNYIPKTKVATYL